ncbi:MAG TPA: AbrB/MazE/SpoVT family DNA-binding domain-containing protein [Baekduia sp.]|nr:AbrB/MazE/SpoVT family DNA-binding domain-containing protein [Baekduia sp.]
MPRAVKNSSTSPSRATRETSRISSKHQITIGRRAFAAAGLKEGDVVDVRAVGAGKVLLDRTDDLLARYSGALRTGGALRRAVDDLRSEWG